MSNNKEKFIKKIEIRLSSKEEFLERYLADIGIGGYQWQGEGISAGEKVLLLISFIGLGAKFELLGTVAWTNSKPPMKPELEAGIGIEFDASVKEDLLGLVRFATLKGDQDILKSKDDRREARLRVSLGCEYIFEDQMVSGRILDITPNGVYIQSPYTLVEETQFVFYLLDEDSIRLLVLEGRVVWSSNEEETGGEAGFGVQLLFDSLKHKIEIKDYYNALGAVLDVT